MTMLVLMSSGASDYNGQGRIQGRLELPLSDAGRGQVAELAEQLKQSPLQALYAAEGEPVGETARLLATALGLKPKTLEGFENLDMGLWQGLLIDEIRQRQPKIFRQGQDQPCSLCPPEGETISEAQERVRETLARLLKKHKAGRIGLVAPEPLASLVRAQLGAGEIDDLWKSATCGCRCDEFDTAGVSLAAK